jgi:hypothetical protein
VSSFLGHGVRNGRSATSSEKLEGIDAQLYMLSRRQCDDSLPKKKMTSCFNHPCNPDAGSRSQKV